MDEQSKREQRKNEHVDLALKMNNPQNSDFDNLLLIHRSLPETGIGEIDLQQKSVL